MSAKKDNTKSCGDKCAACTINFINAVFLILGIGIASGAAICYWGNDMIFGEGNLGVAIRAVITFIDPTVMIGIFFVGVFLVALAIFGFIGTADLCNGSKAGDCCERCFMMLYLILCITMFIVTFAMAVAITVLTYNPAIVGMATDDTGMAICPGEQAWDNTAGAAKGVFETTCIVDKAAFAIVNGTTPVLQDTWIAVQGAFVCCGWFCGSKADGDFTSSDAAGKCVGADNTKFSWQRTGMYCSQATPAGEDAASCRTKINDRIASFGLPMTIVSWIAVAFLIFAMSIAVCVCKKNKGNKVKTEKDVSKVTAEKEIVEKKAEEAV